MKLLDLRRCFLELILLNYMSDPSLALAETVFSRGLSMCWYWVLLAFPELGTAAVSAQIGQSEGSWLQTSFGEQKLPWAISKHMSVGLPTSLGGLPLGSQPSPSYCLAANTVQGCIRSRKPVSCVSELLHLRFLEWSNSCCLKYMFINNIIVFWRSSLLLVNPVHLHE